MESAITHLVGANRLKELLGIRSWYSFGLLRDRGVIAGADCIESGRELWKLSRLQAIKESVQDYERTKSAALHNAISTI
jgi:hypothetical protein